MYSGSYKIWITSLFFYNITWQNTHTVHSVSIIYEEAKILSCVFSSPPFKFCWLERLTLAHHWKDHSEFIRLSHWPRMQNSMFPGQRNLIIPRWMSRIYTSDRHREIKYVGRSSSSCFIYSKPERAGEKLGLVFWRSKMPFLRMLVSMSGMTRW